MRILGIDPGAISGAYALIDTENGEEVYDVPVVDKNVSASSLAADLRALGKINPINAVILERVNAFPGQGVSSSFSFGQGYGTIIGVVQTLGISLHLVPPTVWKKYFKLPGKDKEAARAMAMRFYPEVSGLTRKKDAGRAEALLLARYFLETRVINSSL